MPQALNSDSTAQQMHTKPKDDQKQCLLFKLPPELRNCIYSHATSQSEINHKPVESELPLGKGSQLTYNYDPSSDYNGHQSLPVVNMNHLSEVKPSNALLGTCQRIHQEARAIFAASQRTFWNSHVIPFDLDNNCTHSVSTAQDIVARLHPKQIDSMPRFSVALTIRDCLHTFHFIADDIETTDDEVDNEGHAPKLWLLPRRLLAHRRSQPHRVENALRRSQTGAHVFEDSVRPSLAGPRFEALRSEDTQSYRHVREYCKSVSQHLYQRSYGTIQDRRARDAQMGRGTDDVPAEVGIAGCEHEASDADYFYPALLRFVLAQ